MEDKEILKVTAKSNADIREIKTKSEKEILKVTAKPNTDIREVKTKSEKELIKVTTSTKKLYRKLKTLALLVWYIKARESLRADRVTAC